MIIQGKIYKIFETQQIKDTFKKREFVLEYADNSQYPQLIKFEFTQDKCDELNGFNVGDEVEINFNIRGREWENPKREKVYFNTLQAWKMDKLSESEMKTPAPNKSKDEEFNPDDLPF
ncbi:MAG TPA: hypothetical protein DEP28_00585 [Bacteroidetes bacterium]|nr:DUF3127 domain-containing protein [Ignavibacteria bacterium]HCA41727.1 hypothetical protein [Bacteroidota bacterium]HCN36390.1 hypothetical protein [Bacteroidota bacterium]